MEMDPRRRVDSGCQKKELSAFTWAIDHPKVLEYILTAFVVFPYIKRETNLILLFWWQAEVGRRCNYDEVLRFYDDRKSAQSAAVQQYFGMKVANHVFATYDCQKHFVARRKETRRLLIDSWLSFDASSSTSTMQQHHSFFGCLVHNSESAKCITEVAFTQIANCFVSSCILIPLKKLEPALLRFQFLSCFQNNLS